MSEEKSRLAAQVSLTLTALDELRYVFDSAEEYADAMLAVMTAAGVGDVKEQFEVVVLAAHMEGVPRKAESSEAGEPKPPHGDGDHVWVRVDQVSQSDIPFWCEYCGALASRPGAGNRIWRPDPTLRDSL